MMVMMGGTIEKDGEMDVMVDAHLMGSGMDGIKMGHGMKKGKGGIIEERMSVDMISQGEQGVGAVVEMVHHVAGVGNEVTVDEVVFMRMVSMQGVRREESDGERMGIGIARAGVSKV